jgi:hypothetical protein
MGEWVYKRKKQEGAVGRWEGESNRMEEYGGKKRVEGDEAKGRKQEG